MGECRLSRRSETHTSAGTSATATEWGIAEGEVRGPGNTDTFLALSNRSTSAATARITLLFEDGSTGESLVESRQAAALT